MAFCNLISVILLVILVKTVCAQYYPDLATQESNSSCSEKTLFAISNDPFYNWITRSYLALGFGTNEHITSQEAGIAYRKLSAWRVAKHEKGRMLLFSSPEPHVLGGSFRLGGKNIIARMTVNWGLSIRICGSIRANYTGANLCLYTRQVIASKKNGTLTFKTLLAEVPYVSYNKTRSDVKFLINWVSNANTSGAVGENRTFEKIGEASWYYLNPLLDSTCNGNMERSFIPDLAAFLPNNYLICRCVGNVCVKSISFDIHTGAFINASGCKSLHSYWISYDGGIWLATYNAKSDNYNFLNSTFTTSHFPDSIDQGNVTQMEAISLCFERWLRNNMTPSIRDACANYSLINYDTKVRDSKSLPIIYPVSSISSRIKQAAEAADDCDEVKKVDKICSYDIWSSKNVTRKIERIVAKAGQLQEVKDFGQKQWERMASKRHNVYIDIVTALLAVFTTTSIVFSETLVRLEQKVTESVQLRFRGSWVQWCFLQAFKGGNGNVDDVKDGASSPGLSVMIVWRENENENKNKNGEASRASTPNRLGLNEPANKAGEALSPSPRASSSTAGRFGHKEPETGPVGGNETAIEQGKVEKREEARAEEKEPAAILTSEEWSVIVRVALRILVLIGVISQCMCTAWKSLRALESEPEPAWSQTYQYQPNRKIAFLVTTTSTIEVKPINTTLICVATFLCPYVLILMPIIYSYVKKYPLQVEKNIQPNPISF